MWHLHPERAEGGSFVDDLPSMPAGHYEVFADIVDKAGFPWTLVGQVDLPQINGTPLTGDDSTWTGTPLTAQTANVSVAQLADGGRIVWEKGSAPLVANTAMVFKFKVEDKDGNPAKDMQQYMGMAGHAEFVSADMSVFAHIHPAGSASMAAVEMANGAPNGPPKGTCGMGGQCVCRQHDDDDACPGLQPQVSFPIRLSQGWRV